MKGSKTVSIAHKRLDAEMLKKRKGDTVAKEKKKSKKNSAAPKRPPGAFFVFMEEFRKTFKENFPDNKLISAVGKAGGDKWKSMSESEKAPYVAKALKKKQEYEKALEEFAKKSNGNIGDEGKTESEKSTSEVHDEAEQEASS
ncbi:HMG1/2-like protein [Malania oleifera]|uniref:HMG1/2-like protein n=1 Tax=Malania oleifera TaxID=397392 RepID=UPI0025AEC336|nr:HMG1/2-like protein [Malania oleifera]